MAGPVPKRQVPSPGAGPVLSCAVLLPSRSRAVSAALALFTALAFTVTPGRLAAQAGPAVVGTLVGAAGGAWVTAALVTARARAGHFLFRPKDIGWQLAPIPVLALGGGVLGAVESGRLTRSVTWAAVGFAAGAAVGAIAGSAASDDRQGAWAGAVVGAAVGILAGGVAGALRTAEDAPTELVLVRLGLP